MGKWVREGLKDDKGLLQHLKPLGDMKTPTAPEGMNSYRSSTEKEAGVSHLKGNSTHD